VEMNRRASMKGRVSAGARRRPSRQDAKLGLGSILVLLLLPRYSARFWVEWGICWFNIKRKEASIQCIHSRVVPTHYLRKSEAESMYLMSISWKFFRLII
jgi:hypothetical protein